MCCKAKPSFSLRTHHHCRLRATSMQSLHSMKSSEACQKVIGCSTWLIFHVNSLKQKLADGTLGLSLRVAVWIMRSLKQKAGLLSSLVHLLEGCPWPAVMTCVSKKRLQAFRQLCMEWLPLLTLPALMTSLEP